MIKEYKTGLVWEPHEGMDPYKWTDKISVDLKWVSSVQTHSEGRVQIQMAGGGRPFVIGAHYTDFMRDWLRAKGQ